MQYHNIIIEEEEGKTICGLKKYAYREVKSLPEEKIIDDNTVLTLITLFTSSVMCTV